MTIDHASLARRRRGEGGTHNLACHSHMTIDLASLQSWDGARRVFARTGGEVYSFVACLSRMTIDLASLQSLDGARRDFAGPGGHTHLLLALVV